MKKILAIILSLTMLLSLCACGGSSKSSEDTLREEIQIAVEAKVSAKTHFIEQIKSTHTFIATIDDNGDGTYNIKGKLTIVDDYGDEAETNFDAVVSSDENGDLHCDSFDTEYPLT